MEAPGAFDHFELEAENDPLGHAQHFLKLCQHERRVPPCKIFKIYSAIRAGSVLPSDKDSESSLSTRAALLSTTMFHSSKIPKKAPSVNTL